MSDDDGHTHLFTFNWVLVGVLICCAPLMFIKLAYLNTPTLLGKGMRASNPWLMMWQTFGFLLLAATALAVELRDSYGLQFPCWLALVYCYLYTPIAAIGPQLRALRVLYLFSPKFRMRWSSHRWKVKWIVVMYVMLAIVTVFICVMVYPKYHDGSHGCVLFEDWPVLLSQIVLIRPVTATIAKWIREEKVSDGYNILRELDGQTLVLNVGGLYIIPRAVYSSLRYDVAHISVEYVLFFNAIIAYLYSVLIPLLKQWRMCCYRSRYDAKIAAATATYGVGNGSGSERGPASGSSDIGSTRGVATMTSPGQPVSSIATPARGTPTLSAPHHRLSIPTNHTNQQRSVAAPSAALRAWDEHEMIMLAQAVPHYWQDAQRILRHATTRPLFMETAQRFLCPENVKFWLAVDELEFVSNPTLSQVQELALGIYYDHIEPGAVFEINISAARRTSLARKLGVERSLKNAIKIAHAHQSAFLGNDHVAAGPISPDPTITGGVAAAAAAATKHTIVINESKGPVGITQPPPLEAGTSSSRIHEPHTNGNGNGNGNGIGNNNSSVGIQTSSPAPPPLSGLGLPPPSHGHNNTLPVNPSSRSNSAAIAAAAFAAATSPAGGRPTTATSTTNGALRILSATTSNASPSPMALGGAVSVTEAAIYTLQHCFAGEKLEILQLIRDNLLPPFLSSPAFQAFLKRPEAQIGL